MNAKDFRRIALSFAGAVEGSHMGAVDFRVGGRIFATLASVKQGYGNLMLSLEQQAAFVEEMPDVFLPIPGGWGRMGMTHVRLAQATEDVLTGALRTAWKFRADRHKKSKKLGRQTEAPIKPLRQLKKRSAPRSRKRHERTRFHKTSSLLRRSHQRVHFASGSPTEQNPPFDAPAEKQVGCFGKQLRLRASRALRVKVAAFSG